MPQSANLTSAQAYKDAIHNYGPMFVSKAFFGFKTALMANLYEGNKGKRTITEITVGDLVYAWNKTFNARNNVFDYKPREVVTRKQKIDLSFVPQEFEGTYLGAARKPGQNPGIDLPAEALHFMKILTKIAQENEIAIWRGVVNENIAVDDRKLIQNINGLDTIIATELSANKITPVAVPGGAWSIDNVIPTLEGMWSRLDPSVQEEPLIAYVPAKVTTLYKQAYRRDFGKYTAGLKTDDAIKLDFGNVELISCPGKGNTNRVVMTPSENLLIDFDKFSDTEFVNVETVKRELHVWGDYMMGCNFGIVDDGIMSVSDI